MPAKEQFLYVLKVKRLGMLTEGSTPEEAATMQRHVAYLEQLAAEETAILFGRTLNNDETTFGLVIFEADSESEATRIMLADPAIREDVMEATLFPYWIAGQRGNATTTDG